MNRVVLTAALFLPVVSTSAQKVTLGVAGGMSGHAVIAGRVARVGTTAPSWAGKAEVDLQTAGGELSAHFLVTPWARRYNILLTDVNANPIYQTDGRFLFAHPSYSLLGGFTHGTGVLRVGVLAGYTWASGGDVEPEVESYLDGTSTKTVATRLGNPGDVSAFTAGPRAILRTPAFKGFSITGEADALFSFGKTGALNFTSLTVPVLVGISYAF